MLLWTELGCIRQHICSPLQQLPHHVMDGRVYLLLRELTDSTRANFLHLLSPTCFPADFRDRRPREGKNNHFLKKEEEAQRPDCVRVKPALWTHRTHMLNATYIWYSSIASTNCPHESKSVPFLKLACHFWIVLLTSDMLAGRILAALSGQHSRGGDSSTGLQRQRSRRPGHLLSRGARIDRWHSDQALSACLP